MKRKLSKVKIELGIVLRMFRDEGRVVKLSLVRSFYT